MERNMTFNLDWILYFGSDLNLKIIFFKERVSLGVRPISEQKYCCARYSLHLGLWKREKCPTILMMIWYSFLLFQLAKLQTSYKHKYLLESLFAHTRRLLPRLAQDTQCLVYVSYCFPLLRIRCLVCRRSKNK